MLKTINGTTFVEMMQSGVKNLELHKKELNDLNVFPVPDGDTGTNMLMTVKYGLGALKDDEYTLSLAASSFASSASFGARGNSGVILSQFFKGVADGFLGVSEADAAALSRALSSGYKRAYSAVSKPVEGTMLTVLRESALALERALPLDSIDAAIDVYLAEARCSLDRTPTLLPILKKAGVVDSGGSGVLCFFRGVDMYLKGEEISLPKESEECEVFDFSLVNKDTRFDFGYCVEGLIQLRTEVSEFDHDDFKSDLERIGSSIVTSIVGDKLKLHVHTKQLAKLMERAQRVGEFLTVKIENMTLQNLQKRAAEAEETKFLVRSDECDCEFGVVAVATNRVTQQLFSEMGADVVILSEMAPSSQDFLDAFKLVKKENVIVFPNSSNSILSSMQAATMYRGADVRVVNCRSIAECYSALAVMDFEGSVASAITSSRVAISGANEFSVYLAVKDVRFGNKRISKNEFFSLANDKILDTGSTLESVAIASLKRTLESGEYSVVTVFYSETLAEEYVEYLIGKINDLELGVEIAALNIGSSVSSLTFMCE